MDKRHKFAAKFNFEIRMRIIRLFNSQEGNSFDDKVRNTLNSIIKENSDYNIVKLNFYLNSSNNQYFEDEYNTISNIVKNVFKKQIPAYTIISQQPKSKNDFTVECQLYSSNQDIKYKTILNHPYVTINHENGIELISGGVQFNEESLLFGMQRSFDFVEQILMTEELNFGHIFRQWNYIPNISSTSSYDGTGKLNSTIFNEIKNLFYEEPLFKTGYPVETNTGCNYGNVTIDFMAFSNHTSTIKTIKSFSLKSNPIEVAKYFDTENKEIWISSSQILKDQITKKSDNVEQQTIETLKSILDLLEPNSIAKNNLKISSHKQLKEQFEIVKIYIKHKSDMEKVSKIVSQTLPDIKALIVNADLSLENLLVEIEGIIITTN